MKLVDRIINWVINRAKRTPYFHLDGYMERYWLIKPNPNRWILKDFSIRIHRILRSDDDDCFHDHPWASMSLILRGVYCEVMPKDENQDPALDHVWQRWVLRKPLSIVFRGAKSRHRLVLPAYQDCWTMFVMFRRVNKWGFYTRDGFVPYKQYLGISGGDPIPPAGTTVKARPSKKDSANDKLY